MLITSSTSREPVLPACARWALAEGRVVDALETRSLAQVLIAMFDERMQPSGERLADPLEVHEFLSKSIDCT
jgi:hypothetical protein